jgi:hypothetical protein
LLSFIVVISCQCGSARADSVTGPYIGAGLGAGAYHFDSIGLRERSDPDQASAGGKLKLGYRFTPHWGVELGYVRLGSVSHRYDGGTFKGHAESFYLAGVGRTRLDEHWSAFLKTMLTSSRMRSEGGRADLPDFAALSGRRRNLVLGGLGLEYQWSDAISVALEADSFGKTADRSLDGLVSIDLAWHW